MTPLRRLLGRRGGMHWWARSAMLAAAALGLVSTLTLVLDPWGAPDVAQEYDWDEEAGCATEAGAQRLLAAHGGPIAPGARPQLGSPCFGIAQPFGFHCKYHRGPTYAQCCCVSSSTKQTTCLPTFLVIGSQKSGSTALLGYFLKHPQFLPPVKKECHFFDRVQRQSARKRVAQYIGLFQNARPARSRSSRRQRLTGEATPAYIADSRAAYRIYRNLPHARLVLIVREPVARAYSEYQMKSRRVARQMDLGNQTQFQALHQCVTTCFELQTDVLVTACLRSQLKTVPGFFSLLLKKKAKRRFIPCLMEPKGGAAPSATAVRKCCDEILVFETLRPLQEVMQEEMDKVAECTRDDGADGGPDFRWGTPGCWPKGSTSAISRDYIPRGIYSVQIRNFLRYFAREQLLIVRQSELLLRPQAVMSRVFRHVGLPDAALAGVSESDLNTLIHAVWPNFEETSGWHLQSEYQPLPDGLGRDMAAFYAPFNQQLDRLVGIKFTEQGDAPAPAPVLQ